MTPRYVGWPPNSLAVSSQSFCLFSSSISSLTLECAKDHCWACPLSLPQVISFVSSALNITHMLMNLRLTSPSPWNSTPWHPTACHTAPRSCLANVLNITYLKRNSCFLPQPFSPKSPPNGKCHTIQCQAKNPTVLLNPEFELEQ